MGLIEPGFYHDNYFIDYYWQKNYWLIYDQIIEGSIRGNVTYSSGDNGTITYTGGNSGTISYT